MLNQNIRNKAAATAYSLATLLVHDLGRGFHLLLRLEHNRRSICGLGHNHAFVLGLEDNRRLLLFLVFANDLGVERLGRNLAFADNQGPAVYMAQVRNRGKRRIREQFPRLGHSRRRMQGIYLSFLGGRALQV